MTGTCEEDIANTGDTGDTGNTGDTSDTANTADTGDTGDTGNSGDTADTGDTGNTGNSGNTGDTAGDEAVIDEDADTAVNDEDADTVPDETADEISDESADDLSDEVLTDTGEIPDETVDDITGDDDATGPVTVVNYSFNTDAQGWTHQKIDSATASWPYDMWEQGAATSGPGSCYEGAGCFGFNLDGNYINCQRAQLISPAIDLSAYTGQSLKLEFMHWYDFWASPTSYYDGGFVEFSGNGGTNWSQISGFTYPGIVKIKKEGGLFDPSCDSATFYATNKPGFVQTNSGWTKAEIDIPAEMLTANFKIRFVFSSGIQKNTTSQDPATYSYPGWYVDDVIVAVK